jgi:hypothetical protein
MSNGIEVRANKMKIGPVQMFNHLTNEDLILIAKEGELENLCYALSLDINNTHEIKNEC